MSADLLRRAAAKLRAAASPEYALVLAEWMEAVSPVEEFLTSDSRAVAVARAVLREGAPGDAASH